jgi:ankyrin repeat protein
MASNFFCASPREPVEPPTLIRQHSGIGDAYSVIRASGSNATTSRYHDEPEVDYDEGPTELYRRIEAKQWDSAMQRLESHPFEAKTWVSRKENSSDKTRWRLLPIHATCIFRSPLALIEALIDANAEGAQMKDDQGMLPIHLACRNGASKGVVLTLLNAFPDSHGVKDRKGRTPLDLVETSSSQNAEAVGHAIRSFQREKAATTSTPRAIPNIVAPESVAGATTNEVDYEHRTILFRLLLKKDWKAAVTRAESHPEEAGTWIVTKGFNGNLRFLPLHKACVLQPPAAVIESLLAAHPGGAQCKDQDGWLPIHCACFYGADDSVISQLIATFGKGVQSKDEEGRLPLHYACLKGASQDVVDVLLGNFSKGAMSKDDEGRLPIHHACSKGAPEGVIDALLKASPKGAQSKDDQGRLPLHHACRKSSSERIIRTLLRVYPRASQIKDDQDKLPIHYACQNGTSPTVVTVLLTTYPESINVKNGFGYTPLAEARALENPKMDPIIHVLEKFKVEQDKIKLDSGENAIFEAKLDALNKRVIQLEKMLGSAMDLGVEIKGSVKKAKDPYTLIDRMADRLANLDSTTEESTQSKDSAVKTGSRSMFGRKTASRSRGSRN